MITEHLTQIAQEQNIPVSSLFAEVFHLIMLEALFTHPESNRFHFQGGTSIHLLYGGYRYSEDLDFAGPEIDADLTRHIVEGSKSTIEKITIQYFGNGHCEWKFPTNKDAGKIWTFWYMFQFPGEQRKYRTKIEFARYPVYCSEILPVKSGLNLLDQKPLVNGLSKTELLAEKITALAGRNYLKARDIFDIWYLAQVCEVSPDHALIKKKFHDYQMQKNRKEIETRMKNIDPAAINNEMHRFLPIRYRRQLKKNHYQQMRQTAESIMKTVIDNHF